MARKPDPNAWPKSVCEVKRQYQPDKIDGRDKTNGEKLAEVVNIFTKPQFSGYILKTKAEQDPKPVA